MKRMALVGSVLGTALLAATAAHAQSLAESAAVMGTHSTLAGTSSGSISPVRILADYGNRVAAAQAAKDNQRQGWDKGSAAGARGTGSGGWATASAGGSRGSGWAAGGSARGGGGGGSSWAKGGGR